VTLSRTLAALSLAAALPSTLQAQEAPAPRRHQRGRRADHRHAAPIWRFFGADEPNYATMKDGRKLLLELGDLKKGEVYFRAHNLLSSGDGTAAFKWGSTNAYREDASGKPVYDWTIVDTSSTPIARAASAPICRSALCPRRFPAPRRARPISMSGAPASTTA
jgi:xylan 1,4-beta-xylosidase